MNIVEELKQKIASREEVIKANSSHCLELESETANLRAQNLSDGARLKLEQIKITPEQRITRDLLAYEVAMATMEAENAALVKIANLILTTDLEKLDEKPGKKLVWEGDLNAIQAKGLRHEPYIISGANNTLVILDGWCQDFPTREAAIKVAQKDHEELLNLAYCPQLDQFVNGIKQKALEIAGNEPKLRNKYLRDASLMDRLSAASIKAPIVIQGDARAAIESMSQEEIY